MYADYGDDIKIEDYDSVMQGAQLLVRGSFTNNADVHMTTIEIEAELFNADGDFVYECSEYMTNKIDPGQRENFQIKCGCSKNGLPEHESIKLSVITASSY